MTEENSPIITDSVSQVVAQNPLDLSITSLIMSADLVGKFVIFILIAASIWCWAIIIHKYIHFSKIKKNIKQFEKLFWSGQVLDELYITVKSKQNNPLSAMFVKAISECKKTSDSGNTDILRQSKKERVMSCMNSVRNQQMDALEEKLGFLASVGSAAPFIGLFGTVWGIMHSFQGIAASKNTTLAVVAPGIAEALLATAIGLFAAIPATIFYNYLISEVDKMNSTAENFSTELNAIIVRAIDEGRM